MTRPAERAHDLPQICADVEALAREGRTPAALELIAPPVAGIEELIGLHPEPTRV